jgi:CRISPR-associated endonuclease Csn1
MPNPLRYRLALDLGSTSVGWCLFRLNTADEPVAIIRMGVRIFPNGREAAPPGRQGESLAKNRRERRQARRRRDRFLRRRQRLVTVMARHGFFPSNEEARRALVGMDPYELRRRGLDHALTPTEFGRALFHIHQRRGFRSNRKTDKKDSDSSVMKAAIRSLRAALSAEDCRTVGEWLARRHDKRLGVRARYREVRTPREDGKIRIEKSYDLYVDRQMIEEEFDAIWATQAGLDPSRFNEGARTELKGVLLHQRPLRPVRPGRCTLMPEFERAPLALPSTQRFRIWQELGNLKRLDQDLREVPLDLAERDRLFGELCRHPHITFDKVRKLLGVGGAAKYNLEDAKRDRLKGDSTAVELAKPEHFGEAWHHYDLAKQDAIVEQLIGQEEPAWLRRWLLNHTGVDDETADRIATSRLVDGYGNLSREAMGWVLPELQRSVIGYAEAVKRASALGAPFDHHSVLSHSQSTGELLPALPYYGEYLQRHVGFGTREEKDRGNPAEYFGRIANPTVHIGLNQVRKVVNRLIARYGRPTEVIVEVARDLKQSQARREEISKDQAARQRQNEQWTSALTDPAGEVRLRKVSALDLQRMKLWQELSANPADRRCPYTGEPISLGRLFSAEVEVEHILPFKMTLDDSLNNKTVALRRANRDKGNRTPWQAFGERRTAGYDYDGILQRAKLMPREKAKRFAPDGYERWLNEDRDFVARALTDTAYLSRVAREYLSLVCPYNKVRVIPGRLTALLRGKFGFNDALGVSGEKNRNDHRHHAIDAAVIGVTDQGLLQRFAQASARAWEAGLHRLVDDMPMPWPTYPQQVRKAVEHVIVCHKPDHSHERRLHNETAYGLLGDGLVAYTKVVEGRRVREPERLAVIEMTEPAAAHRHGARPDGSARPYKGYKGDSNYCIEILRGDGGRWEGRVVSTFEAYQLVRAGGVDRLRDSRTGVDGKPLVMRLMIDDMVRLNVDSRLRLMRVAKISGNGQVFMADHHEANADARNRDKSDEFGYVSKYAGSFRSANARRVTVSPIGELRDAGFKE